MATQDGPGGGLGGRVAGRIAQTVADATVNTRQRLGGHTAAVAQSVLRDFTNHVSDEIQGVMHPLWRKYADDPDTPELARGLFTALATERGQAWAFVGGLVTSSAFAGGLATLLENELAPITHKLIAGNPHNVLSANDAAVALAKGFGPGVDLEYDMAAQGYDVHRRQALIQLAEASLTPDAIVTAMHRGIVGHQDARSLLGRLGYREEDIPRILAVGATELSPQDYAAAWARNLVTGPESDQKAARAGMSGQDMAILRGLAGEPPSPQELLFAWRRGIIKESDVDRGLVEGPIRNEWLPAIKALQWQPLTVEDAANAVNQGHMDIAKATEIAKHNGVTAEDFAVIIANAGIPPGPQEALDWVSRGIITEQEFRQIFLESRIKNRYIDLYLASRTQTIPPETVRLLVTRGALSTEEGLLRLQARGYTPEDAAIIMAGAHAAKTAATKDLTVAQIRDLYSTRAMSRDEATATLAAFGYDPAEIDWELLLADLARIKRFETAAVNRVHASYLKAAIDENQAVAALDAIGMPPEQRDDVIRLWQQEIATPSKTLTLAEVKAALKKGFIDETEFLSRVSAMGYDSADTQLQLRLTVG